MIELVMLGASGALGILIGQGLHGAFKRRRVSALEQRRLQRWVKLAAADALDLAPTVKSVETGKAGA